VTRAVLLRARRCFTTSFHTRFPEYIQARFGLPVGLSYAALRRFHNAGAGVMVSTPSLSRELSERGFRRILRWSRGVDHALFTPDAATPLGFERPISFTPGDSPLGKRRDLCARSAGHEARRRRRPGARRARSAISAGPVSWPEIERRTCGALRLVGRFRLSEPHRHIRHCAARSHGLRPAGRPVGHRSARCHQRDRAALDEFAVGGARRSWH
jgi:hypothetical protein